ncbi:MAG TPA: hypothetical protein VFP66_11610 [Candidatus Limnocylindrales bacterium]|nr:hypothetical protein [Candidatus Limnocylindrales bacterium]
MTRLLPNAIQAVLATAAVLAAGCAAPRPTPYQVLVATAVP